MVVQRRGLSSESMEGSSATAARWKKSSRLALFARAARWGMAGSN